MTAPAYSIRPAQAEDVPALSAIELAAAQLLRGNAPESVLAETTDVGRFATRLEIADEFRSAGMNVSPPRLVYSSRRRGGGGGRRRF